MAKIRTVRVEYGRTVQTAPYESLKFHLAIEKDLEPEDDVKTEIKKTAAGMSAYVKNAIKKEMEKL